MEEATLQRIEQRIQETIKLTVNGKIDKLAFALNEHIEEHKADRAKMEPMIENFKNWSWLRKMLWSVFVPLLLALGGVGGVKELFTFFKN